MKKSARRLVEDLDLGTHPGTYVAVIEYNDDARVLTGLTNVEEEVVRAINRVGVDGSTAVDRALLMALDLLIRARTGGEVVRGPAGVGQEPAEAPLKPAEAVRSPAGAGQQPAEAPQAPAEAVVVYSDGNFSSGCYLAERAAKRLAREGIPLVTVCVGDDCNERCLRGLASSPELHFNTRKRAELASALTDMRSVEMALTAVDLELQAVLPANVRYLGPSAAPRPVTPPDQRQLLWRGIVAPADGFTVTFGVEPLEAGTWPVAVRAGGHFTTTDGVAGVVRFEPPRVSVLRPDTVPTPGKRAIYLPIAIVPGTSPAWVVRAETACVAPVCAPPAGVRRLRAWSRCAPHR